MALSCKYQNFDNFVKMSHKFHHFTTLAHRLTEANGAAAAISARLSISSTGSDLPPTGISRELKYRGGKMIEVETDEDDNEFRVYLYQSLSREDNAIWKIPQLWENAFLDVVRDPGNIAGEILIFCLE